MFRTVRRSIAPSAARRSRMRNASAFNGSGRGRRRRVTRYVSYLRVSTQRQDASGLGLAVQREAVARHAATGRLGAWGHAHRQLPRPGAGARRARCGHWRSGHAQDPPRRELVIVSLGGMYASRLSRQSGQAAAGWLATVVQERSGSDVARVRAIVGLYGYLLVCLAWAAPLKANLPVPPFTREREAYCAEG
jgi:hypothetical protein